MTIADLVEGAKVQKIEHEGDMLVATLSDGSKMKSYFAIRYECQDDKGEWIDCEMIGCETPEETFQLAKDLREISGARNVKVVREDAY